MESIECHSWCYGRWQGGFQPCSSDRVWRPHPYNFTSEILVREFQLPTAVCPWLGPHVIFIITTLYSWERLRVCGFHVLRGYLTQLRVITMVRPQPHIHFLIKLRIVNRQIAETVWSPTVLGQEIQRKTWPRPSHQLKVLETILWRAPFGHLALRFLRGDLVI